MQFQVTFSESVTGVDASDFQAATTGSVTNGNISVTGSGTTYSVTVNGINGEGTLGLNVIDDDTIRDILSVSTQTHALGGAGAGNGNFLAGEAYTIDRIVPAVESIARTGSVTINGQTAQFLVTFSEDATGVDASDFLVTTSGLTGCSITGVSGSGSEYTMTVDIGTGAGTIRLDLADNDSIIDTAGNILGGMGVNNGTFTSGENYLVVSTDTDSLATVVLPALDLNLLGLRVQTSEILLDQ